MDAAKHDELGGWPSRGFAREQAAALIECVRTVTAAAPLRQMETPGGFRMSVAMSNCGRLGWVTDRTGYRYPEPDPETGSRSKRRAAEEPHEGHEQGRQVCVDAEYRDLGHDPDLDEHHEHGQGDDPSDQRCRQRAAAQGRQPVCGAGPEGLITHL